MGLLMLAGLVGTIAYTGYFVKNETRAIIGDATIQPGETIDESKQKIEQHFSMICKRCGVKLDNNGNPIHEKHYNVCLAYLKYQGFQSLAIEYFKELYLNKYHHQYENKIDEIKDRHQYLTTLFYDEYDKCETKIFRHWHYGDTEKKCKKMMNNWFWSHMVTHYNIVKDSSANVEVWSIKAPPSILKQIDTIYDEVCILEGIYKY